MDVDANRLWVQIGGVLYVDTRICHKSYLIIIVMIVDST